MSSRNQNKQPAPYGPVNKNRGRQPLAPINTQKDLVPVTPSETQVSECENIDFTTDEVDELFNETFKGKKFDSKGKQNWMTEYIKKLRLCIKWSQKGLKDIVEEKNNLHAKMDSSKRKYVEAEAAMKIKEEELKATISKLENNYSSLKDSFANEESQKLDAIDCHKIEKEAQLALEKDQVSLKEATAKAEQNAIAANEKFKTQEDMYKRLQLQEYHTYLQQEKSYLENELETAKDAYEQVEKEKFKILKKDTTLRGRCNLLEKDIISAKDSRDESVKQKETAVKEVDILRGELQKLREDREHQFSQILELSSEIIRYNENIRRTSAEC